MENDGLLSKHQVGVLFARDIKRCAQCHHCVHKKKEIKVNMQSIEHNMIILII